MLKSICRFLTMLTLLSAISLPASAEDFDNLLTFAEGGLASAQRDLGIMYSSGEGVLQDYSKALYWYQKAAAQGDAKAQNNLGVMHLNGKGTPVNEIEAASWIRKADLQGNIRAQHNLGILFETGAGVQHNLVSSHVWYNIVASRATDWFRKEVSNTIDNIELQLSSDQITEAQKLASKCLESHYMECP